MDSLLCNIWTDPMSSAEKCNNGVMLLEPDSVLSMAATNRKRHGKRERVKDCNCSIHLPSSLSFILSSWPKKAPGEGLQFSLSRIATEEEHVRMTATVPVPRSDGRRRRGIMGGRTRGRGIRLSPSARATWIAPHANTPVQNAMVRAIPSRY